MEKKQKNLAERIADIFGLAVQVSARPKVIDLRPYVGKNRGKLS